MPTYLGAGVDVEGARRWIHQIRRLTNTTRIPGAIGQIGGFGGFFRASFPDYRDPILVSSTDGVGTKLKIAQLVDKHDTVGIDLVAMNANDILCCGAKPLFFLDYIACGKLNPHVLTEVVKGIATGCRLTGCALIGGETAQMPAMYSADEYDLAGFCVGVVERRKIVNGSRIHEGNSLIGLASSGLHSNGFSLVRKVFSQREQKRLSKELLRPTRIYVKVVLSLLKKIRVNGIAHITGGSFQEKLTRILPGGLGARIWKGSWEVPSIFRRLQTAGVVEGEMYRTFNMGIGLVLAVPKTSIEGVTKVLHQERVKSFQIGEVIRSKEAIEWE